MGEAAVGEAAVDEPTVAEPAQGEPALTAHKVDMALGDAAKPRMAGVLTQGPRPGSTYRRRESPGSRIAASPGLPALERTGRDLRLGERSPVTVAGPRRTRTGFLSCRRWAFGSPPRTDKGVNSALTCDGRV